MDAEKSSSTDKRDYWNGRAKEFSRHAATTAYPEKFLALMDIGPGQTVLDMACGGGTLTIPLASQVKQVTAVDFSENMLESVRRRCSEKCITNVQIIQGRWEDDWEALGIGKYDIAIASRSLIGDDPRDFIVKLDKAATREVYISMVSGKGPADSRLLEATGRSFPMGHDYIWYYNILYDMGIKAHVSFIREEHTNSWESHEAAFEGQRWMFRDMTGEEEEIIKSYLKENLRPVGGRWQLPYEKKCYWAVMWWSK